MFNPRWPQTCTTCWPTTDTSWTVAASSRWRGRGRWPPTSSPAAPRVVNDAWTDRRVHSHCVDETECSAWRRARFRHSGMGMGDEANREGSTRWLSLRCTHVGRWSRPEALSRAVQEITKPSCLRMEVAMLVLNSNSTSISSGAFIYFCDENKTVLFFGGKKCMQGNLKEKNNQRTNNWFGSHW